MALHPHPHTSRRASDKSGLANIGDTDIIAL